MHALIPSGTASKLRIVAMFVAVESQTTFRTKFSPTFMSHLVRILTYVPPISPSHRNLNKMSTSGHFILCKNAALTKSHIFPKYTSINYMTTYTHGRLLAVGTVMVQLWARLPMVGTPFHVSLKYINWSKHLILKLDTHRNYGVLKSLLNAFPYSKEGYKYRIQHLTYKGSWRIHRCSINVIKLIGHAMPWHSTERRRK